MFVVEKTTSRDCREEEKSTLTGAVTCTHPSTSKPSAAIVTFPQYKNVKLNPYNKPNFSVKKKKKKHITHPLYNQDPALQLVVRLTH